MIIRLSLRQRVAAFNRQMAKWPAAQLHVAQEQGHDVCYGHWVIGAMYGNATRFYGAYPRTYVNRVMALFPDTRKPYDMLHAFSGSVPAGNYLRCDIKQPSELPFSIYDLPAILNPLWVQFRLCLADVPYTAQDALKYDTGMVNRLRATEALAAVVEPRGHLVWLDQCWPMHSKQQWRTVGRITLIRSTNHRVRLVSIFERV